MSSKLKMNNGTTVKIFKECNATNFVLVYNLFNENFEEWDESTTVKLLIECCRVFYGKPNGFWNETNKENADSLLKVLLLCNKRINKIDGDLVLGYCQAIYFLVINILENKQYEKIVQLSHLLIPNFILGLKHEKALKIYDTLCGNVYNTIVKEFNNSDKNYIYCKFLKLYLEMRILYLPTKVTLAEVAFPFLKSRRFSECSTDMQEDFYSFTFELINKYKGDVNDNIYSEDIYGAILKILEAIIEIQMKQNRIHQLKELIDLAIKVTSTSCHILLYQKLFRLISSVTELIINLLITEKCTENISNLFDSCYEGFNDFCKKFGFSTNLQKTCNLISILIYNWSIYLAKANKQWKFLDETQVNKMLFKFINGVGKVVSKVPLRCSLCSNCKLQTDLITSVNITSTIADIWKVSITQGQEVSSLMCVTVLHYFENCCKNIKILKDLNCKSWKILWKEVGTSFYNVGVKLHSIKNRECSKFFSMIFQTHVYLEGIDTNSIFKFDIISSCLMCLSETYLKFKEFDSALTFAALKIIVCENNTETVNNYKQWIRCKSLVRESTNEEIFCLNKLTVVECLKQGEEKIRTIYPNFVYELGRSQIINLLFKELESYHSLWQSKVPMKCAFMELYKVADVVTSVKALTKFWSTNFFLIIEDFFTIFPEILDKLECETNVAEVEKQIYMASLFVIQYHCETLKVRNKMIETINNTVVVEEPAPLPLEHSKNPNDEFDLVSSHANLKLDVHGKILDILSKSLCLLKKAVMISTVEVLEEYQIYKIVLNIIYEFKIHRNCLKTISACFLGLRISKLLQNNIFTLEMASLLLEESTISDTNIQDILTECKDIKKELCNDNSPDVIAALVQFHTSKALMLFRKGSVELGYTEYKITYELCSKLPKEAKYESIKLKVQFLHVKFLHLPCKFKIEGHTTKSLQLFSQVYNDITVDYKRNGSSSLFTILLYLDLSEFVANFYNGMHLPREVRYFCRNIVRLAQSMVFPIRTASFIIHLAQADLLSSRLDDCYMKLKELSNILCLQNDRLSDYKYIKTKNVQVLVEGLRDLNLNEHCNDQKLRGSPRLLKQELQLPAFMEHSENCDCFYCVSVEYKCLILMHIAMVAQLNLNQGNLSIANIYFQNGFKIYDCMLNSKRKNSFEDKIMKEMLTYPLYDLKDLLCPSYCIILLHYGYFLIKSRDFTKANIINDNLVNIISKNKYSNKFLYDEAHFQKTVIILTEIEETQFHVKNLDSEVGNARSEKENLEIIKTPNNKHSKVMLSPLDSAILPPKRRLRKIKFNLSNEDDGKSLKVEHNTVNSPPKRRIRKTKINNSDENADISLKEDNGKAMSNLSRKLKRGGIISEISSCVTPALVKTQELCMVTTVKRTAFKKILTNNVDESELDTSNVIPQSPNAYSSKYATAQTSLKKISRRKNLGMLSEDATKTKKTVKNSNNLVCKNLLNEMFAEDNKTKCVTDDKIKINSTKNSSKESVVSKRLKAKEETKLPRPTRSCKRV